MLNALSILFTALLVLDCLFLILLVLVQLPKKEAGAGMAFGGAATDALFGPGSGTALTKITKYAAIGFLGLSLALAVMNKKSSGAASLEEKLKEKASQTLPTGAPTPAPAETPKMTAPTPAPTGTPAPATSPAPATTPAPAAPETTAPAPK